MAAFKEYLDEVFNKPYVWQGGNGSKRMQEFMFDDDERNLFRAFIVQQHLNDKTVNVTKMIGADFVQDVCEIGFTKNDSNEMSPSNAFRVFATMKEIVRVKQSLIEEYATDNVVLIVGKSSDKGRIKFYKSVIKMLQKQLKYTDIKIEKQGNVTYFITWKK